MTLDEEIKATPIKDWRALERRRPWIRFFLRVLLESTDLLHYLAVFFSWVFSRFYQVHSNDSILLSCSGFTKLDRFYWVFAFFFNTGNTVGVVNGVFSRSSLTLLALYWIAVEIFETQYPEIAGPMLIKVPAAHRSRRRSRPWIVFR